MTPAVSDSCRGIGRLPVCSSALRIPETGTISERSAAAHRPDWIQFEWLPAYAPELNPVEQCWNRTKYSDLPNFIPDDIDHLGTAKRSPSRTKATVRAVAAKRRTARGRLDGGFFVGGNGLESRFLRICKTPVGFSRILRRPLKPGQAAGINPTSDQDINRWTHCDRAAVALK